MQVLQNLWSLNKKSRGGRLFLWGVCGLGLFADEGGAGGCGAQVDAGVGWVGGASEEVTVGGRGLAVVAQGADG